MTHETAVHRADAALAVGASYTLDPQLASDGIVEWLELATLPQMLEVSPDWRELPGPGRTLGFVASDTAESWTLDMTGDVLTWRHGAADTAVTVHGPLTELLLLLYRRHGPDHVDFEVRGDKDLLDFWHARVAFG